MREECGGVWECGVAAEMCSRAAAAAAAQTYLCVLDAYVSVLPAFIPGSPANLSVSARGKKSQKNKNQGLGFSVWVAGICLSAARAFPLYFYVCLSAKPDSWKCLPKERSLAWWAGGLPRREEEGGEREARESPSISAGSCDCRLDR